MLDVLAKPACPPPPPPATSTSLPQQCASAGQAREHGNNLRRCATLARFATVGVSMARGGHLPRWTTDVDRKRDERFFNSCCCCMSVCTLADHRPFIGNCAAHAGSTKALSPRDSRHVHFVEPNIRTPSRATLRVGFELTFIA